MKKFYSIDPDKIRENYHHRFEKDVIIKKFDVLQASAIYNNNYIIELRSIYGKLSQWELKLLSHYEQWKASI